MTARVWDERAGQSQAGGPAGLRGWWVPSLHTPVPTAPGKGTRPPLDRMEGRLEGWWLELLARSGRP